MDNFSDVSRLPPLLPVATCVNPMRPPLRGLPQASQCVSLRGSMFSHVVIFWVRPEVENATEKLLAGAEKYLRPIPGVLSFHVGKMSPSERSVVDQSYQVALNLQFTTKAEEQAYQVHPEHLEFVEKVFKPICQKAVVYDFE